MILLDFKNKLDSFASKLILLYYRRSSSPKLMNDGLNKSPYLENYKY